MLVSAINRDIWNHQHTCHTQVPTIKGSVNRGESGESRKINIRGSLIERGGGGIFLGPQNSFAVKVN